MLGNAASEVACASTWPSGLTTVVGAIADDAADNEAAGAAEEELVALAAIERAFRDFWFYRTGRPKNDGFLGFFAIHACF